MTSYFQTRRLAKIITSLLFILVFSSVSIGIYFFFISGFRYIQFNVEAEFREPLLLFVNEMFLLVLSGVIVLSSIISGIFTLFRGNYDAWILSSPGYKIFPRISFITSTMSSSWPLFVMFIPALCAFLSMGYISIVGLFFVVISVLLFLAVLNALTFSFVIAIGYVYYHFSRVTRFITFSFRGMIGFLVLAVIACVLFVATKVRGIDLVALFKAGDVDTALSIATIGDHFRWLPSHPFALQIVFWQSGHVYEALTLFLVLFVLAAVTLLIFWLISPFFYCLWQKFQEGESHVITENVIQPRSVVGGFQFRGGLTRVLFKKEVLTAMRNTKGNLWALFLFCLWLAQLGINVVSKTNLHRYQIDATDKVAIMQAIQFIIAIYFMCAFVLRFVFPSFSLEKRTSWILGTAPLRFRKIFFGRYFFYVVSFIFIGVVMNYIDALVLNLPVLYSLYTTTLLISMIMFIVTLGLTLGALFPSFETDDPESISTSMPGLFFTGISLAYGALCAFLLYRVLIDGRTLLLGLCVGVTLVFSIVLLGVILKIRTYKTQGDVSNG